MKPRGRRVVVWSAVIAAAAVAAFSLWVAARSMAAACCDPKQYAALPDGGVAGFGGDLGAGDD